MLMSTIVDMLLGMILGMVASPIMMNRECMKRKVDKILREAADEQETEGGDNNHDHRYRIL
jgi:hypothetical protein